MVFMSTKPADQSARRDDGSRPPTVTAAFVTIVALVLTGCTAHTGTSRDRKPQVVAAFYPYAYVVQRVGGNSVDVIDLTPPGLEPHDLELTPQQVAQLSEADLVVYESGFQPSIDSALEQDPPAKSLDVTDVVPLQPLTDFSGIASRASTPTSTATTGSANDPHLWLDPTNLIPIARRVAAALADADPTHAGSYTVNAAKLITDLHHLDADFRSGLAHCQRKEFVPSHAAFGYLAARYGLTMVPIAGLSPDVEPSPQHLADLQQTITSEGITTVFSERLDTSAYADALAHDLDLTAAVLDPVEGLTSADSTDEYLSLMRANLAALRKANGCR